VPAGAGEGYASVRTPWVLFDMDGNNRLFEDS
jgi:hypothetical protein